MTTTTSPLPAADRGQRREPLAVLIVAVFATAVALGVASGTGALVGPVAAEFGVGAGSAAMMFSLALFSMLLAGAVTGPLAQRLGPRPLVVAGALLVPGGLVLVAGTEQFWLACAGYGLGVGGGAGCVFVPMLAAVGAAFDVHRATALTIASAGGGIGTIATAPAAAALTNGYGLRAALQVLAAATAAVLGVCVFLLRRHTRCPAPPAADDSPGVWALTRDAGFRRLYLGAVGVSAGMFVPFIHLASYATAHGIDLVAAGGLIAVIGAASLAGRLTSGLTAARWGAWSVYQASAVGIAVSLGLWLFADGDRMVLAAFAVVFGLAHGGCTGLASAVPAVLYGPAGFATRLGVFFTAGALGALIGPIAAGVATDATGGPAAGVVLATGLAAAGCVALRGVTASADPDRS